MAAVDRCTLFSSTDALPIRRPTAPQSAYPPRPPSHPPPLLTHPPLPAHPPFYRRAPTSSLRGLQRRRRGRRRRRPLCLGHHRVGGDDERPRRPHLLPPRRCGRHLRRLPPVWWRRLGVCRRQVRGEVRAGGIYPRGPIQCFANASCTDGTCIKCVPASEACGGDTAAQCFGNAFHSGRRAPPSPVGRETATALRGGASPPASPPPRVASFRPLSPPSARPARSTSRRRPPPPTPPAACTPSPPHPPSMIPRRAACAPSVDGVGRCPRPACHGRQRRSSTRWGRRRPPRRCCARPLQRRRPPPLPLPPHGAPCPEQGARGDRAARRPTPHARAPRVGGGRTLSVREESHSINIVRQAVGGVERGVAAADRSAAAAAAAAGRGADGRGAAMPVGPHWRGSNRRRAAPRPHRGRCGRRQARHGGGGSGRRGLRRGRHRRRRRGSDGGVWATQRWPAGDAGPTTAGGGRLGHRWPLLPPVHPRWPAARGTAGGNPPARRRAPCACRVSVGRAAPASPPPPLAGALFPTSSRPFRMAGALIVSWQPA